MADNIDHNPAIFDDKESLQAIGIISRTIDQVAERVATSFTIPAVPRKKHEKIANVTKDKVEPLMHYVNHKKIRLS